MNRVICWIAGVACGLVLPASGLAKVEEQPAQPREIQTHEVKLAKEPKTGSSFVKEITVAGTVTATRDNKGKLKTVDLTGDDGVTYNIEPRGDGILIAAESGRRVEVTGRVEEKKGKKWIIVGRFKVVP